MLHDNMLLDVSIECLCLLFSNCPSLDFQFFKGSHVVYCSYPVQHWKQQVLDVLSWHLEVVFKGKQSGIVFEAKPTCRSTNPNFVAASKLLLAFVFASLLEELTLQGILY